MNERRRLAGSLYAAHEATRNLGTHFCRFDEQVALGRIRVLLSTRPPAELAYGGSGHAETTNSWSYPYGRLAWSSPSD